MDEFEILNLINYLEGIKGRKGLGHPDYLADSIAEKFSVNLSKYYIEHFGKILHHCLQPQLPCRKKGLLSVLLSFLH